MLLHTWGSLNGAASLDPECLALELLIQSNSLDVQIVADNNLLKGELPALEDGTETISGYIEIINYLQQQGMLERNLTDTAAQFYCEKLTSLSLYLLFETKNYEEVVRPAISASVRFPMQYNLTIELQRAVKQRSKCEGLHPPKNIKKVEPPKGVSKTHEKMLQETSQRQQAIKGTQKTSFALAQAKPIYAHLEGILEDLEPNGPAYCLVAANLLLQMLDLPDKTFKPAVEDHPKLVNLTKWAQTHQAQVPVKADRDAYCFTNFVASKINSFWA